MRRTIVTLAVLLLAVGIVSYAEQTIRTDLLVKGKIRTTGLVELKEGAAPAVSGTGFARLYVNATDHKLYVSRNGGAYTEVPAAGDIASTIAAGTVAAPGLGFSGDTNTGLYRIGADNMGIAANGAKVLDIGTAGLGVTGLLTLDAGTAAAPTVTWSGDTNCGIYRYAADRTGFTAGGAVCGIIDTNGLWLASGAGIKPITTTAGHSIALQGYNPDTTAHLPVLTVYNADTGTLPYASLSQDLVIANGKALQTSTTDAHTASLKGYDVDGTAYVALATITNGNEAYLSFPRGFRRTYRATNATGDIAVTDHIVAATGGAGGITLTLPAAATAGAGWEVVVKKIDGAAGAITLEGAGAETIDGNLNVSLATQWEVLTVASDGSNWLVTSSDCEGGL